MAVLFHAGHQYGFEAHRREIQFLLRSGYTVAGLSMPLVGMNRHRTIRLEGYGHDGMAHLPHPLQFFIDPAVRTVNHFAGHGRPVAMIGLSGGGWTTVLTAAVDPRVRRSYPVAGSYPLAFLPPDRRGDFENRYPRLLSRFSYQTLYALGAAEGRRQVHVFNEFDPCCFGGRGFERWTPAVRREAKRLDGTFRVWLDKGSQRHWISPRALRVIAADMATGQG